MSFNGGTNPLVILGGIIFIIAIAYFVFIRNSNFLNRLLGGKTATGVGVQIEGVDMIYNPKVRPLILEKRLAHQIYGAIL